MLSRLVTAAVASLTLAGMAHAQAPSGPSAEFLCNAQASKKRLVPGSAVRRDFIKACIAQSRTQPTPEAKPTPPRPAAPSNPAPEQRPRAPAPANLKK